MDKKFVRCFFSPRKKKKKRHALNLKYFGSEDVPAVAGLVRWGGDVQSLLLHWLLVFGMNQTRSHSITIS